MLRVWCDGVVSVLLFLEPSWESKSKKRSVAYCSVSANWCRIVWYGTRTMQAKSKSRCISCIWSSGNYYVWLKTEGETKRRTRPALYTSPPCLLIRCSNSGSRGYHDPDQPLVKHLTTPKSPKKPVNSLDRGRDRPTPDEGDGTPKRSTVRGGSRSGRIACIR